MSGKRGRLARLEAQRRAWEVEHLPLSDLACFLGAVLGIVEEEAGRDAASRVAGRMVAQKAVQVARLQGGRA